MCTSNRSSSGVGNSRSPLTAYLRPDCISHAKSSMFMVREDCFGPVSFEIRSDLCCSGYTQSASIFKNRLSAIRKQCSAGTTFKFLDPPHIVHSVNLPDGSLVSYDSTADTSNPEELPRAWFFAKDVEGQPGLKRYEGMGDTWKLLKETLEAERFDVVLGFSQGRLIHIVSVSVRQ